MHNTARSLSNFCSVEIMLFRKLKEGTGIG